MPNGCDHQPEVVDGPDAAPMLGLVRQPVATDPLLAALEEFRRDVSRAASRKCRALPANIIGRALAERIKAKRDAIFDAIDEFLAVLA